MNFKGKTVLVTGSSRGIGKDIAINFAMHGANIILNCKKNIDKLGSVYNKIIDLGVDCTPIQCDVSNYEEVKIMIEKIYKKYNNIDILINNAGISHIGLFTDLKPNEYDDIMNTNVKSIYNTCHEILPNMINNKSGNIINISSMWGICGSSCEVAYSASKGAVNSLTKALARELGPSNIRVNAIACGFIDTEMNNHLSLKEKNEFISDIPLMKVGKPRDVSNLCLYLASESSKYMTGQVISLDGGIN